MLNDPRFTVDVELTIPFHDVDAMGVVWHGNYFRYFEIAREKLLGTFQLRLPRNESLRLSSGRWWIPG